MSVSVSLYSNKENEIYSFLDKYNNKIIVDIYTKEWSKNFENPIEIADIIGVFIDNSNKYNLNMWISLDENFYINVNNTNADKIIRYLFERYPY